MDINERALAWVNLAEQFGAAKAAVIDISDVVCDRKFRAMCEANYCGVYGKCWMCPPDVGDIDELIEQVKGYSCGLLYQTIHELEDSFDYEGMQAASKEHAKCTYGLDARVREFLSKEDYLHLSRGGCGYCARCAKADGEPCRAPEFAIASLEAYGINVSATTAKTPLKYINGKDTVTYFGMILFRGDLPCLA